MSSPLLSIKHISKRFGSHVVLDDVTFTIAPNEFLTILGESGSGKTTLLRIIAGFEAADSGELRMHDQRLDQTPAHERHVNTVFQSYALFPHLSVFENVAYGLRAKRMPKEQIAPAVNAALAQMKMSDFVGRRPAQLSGGQQQRIALARALVNRPSLLLLDEPLSALDASLRVHMQMELKALQRETGITFVFVTHDQEEAMTLSDRIAVLRHGCVEQLDSPRELYNSPRTAYVASFIGRANLLPGGLAVRPENIRIVPQYTAGTLQYRGTIRKTIFAGATEMLAVECEAGLLLQVRVPAGATFPGEVLLEVPQDRVIRLS